jgi:chorismate mutase / prephenate dehydratase
MPHAGTDPHVAALRVEIDASDRALLDAMNARVDAVRRLHDYKQAHGLALVDAGREEAIITGLRQANPGPLSPDGVTELARQVLALTRREVTRLRGA